MEAQKKKMEADLEDLKTQARSDKAKNEADIRDLKKQIMEEERKVDELRRTNQEKEKNNVLVTHQQQLDEMNQRMERLMKEAGLSTIVTFNKGFDEAMNDCVEGGREAFGLPGALAGAAVGLGVGFLRGAMDVLGGK